MSSPSESLCRLPCASAPASAVRISGRVPYAAPGGDPGAEPASRRPPASTTITRPPAAPAAVRTIGCRARASSRRPAALGATPRAWARACARPPGPAPGRAPPPGPRPRRALAGSSRAGPRAPRASARAHTRTRGAARRGGSWPGGPARGAEHEPDAAPRVELARRGRVVPELLAQAADVDVERLRGAEPVDVPHLVDEPLARDDRAGAAHEQREQVELLGGRLDGRAGPRHRAGRGIEADVADLDRRVLVGGRGRRGRRGGAAQHGADAGGDLAGAERLDDVVVGAELEADHAVGLLAPGGQHDDRHLRVAPDLAGDVVARAVGEHEVEQDEVRADGRRLLERGGGGAGHLEMEALAREGLGEGLRDGRLVLDQEDRPPAGCHVHIVGGHRSFSGLQRRGARLGGGRRALGERECDQSSPPWPPPPWPPPPWPPPPWPPPPRPPWPPLSSPAPMPAPPSSFASWFGPSSAPRPRSSPASWFAPSSEPRFDEPRFEEPRFDEPRFEDALFDEPRFGPRRSSPAPSSEPRLRPRSSPASWFGPSSAPRPGSGGGAWAWPGPRWRWA